MKYIFFYFILVFSIFSCRNTIESQTIELSPKEIQTLLKKENPQIIDVRTSEEFSEEHVADAINIDFFAETFLNDIQKLDKNKPVLLYCRSGKRSAKSAEEFKKAGFKKIYTLEGGLIKWKSEGFNLLSP